MDKAEIYLLLTRPTFVPVWGEAVTDGFLGRIELADWDWNLHYEDQAKSAKGAKSAGTGSAAVAVTANAKANKQVSAAESRSEERLKERVRTMTQLTSKERWDKLDPRNRQHKIQDFFTKEAKGEVADAREDANAARDDAEDEAASGAAAGKTPYNAKYTFNFSKRVDCATTQMLNSMKAGDLFPTAIITIKQRSSNSGLQLRLTVQKLRLVKYTLKVDMQDTMTDLLEDWEATFEALAYVYENRGIIDKSATSNVGQAVAKGVSQGTPRVFTMKSLGSPLG